MAVCWRKCVVVLSLLVAGCDGQATAPVPTHAEPSAGVQKESVSSSAGESKKEAQPDAFDPRKITKVEVDRTSDCDVWPDYNMPLEIDVAVPPVPAEIRGPFPEKPVSPKK